MLKWVWGFSRREGHEQSHRTRYACSSGCELLPQNELGIGLPKNDLINKAPIYCNTNPSALINKSLLL
jgi:hypothetical protein